LFQGDLVLLLRVGKGEHRARARVNAKAREVDEGECNVENLRMKKEEVVGSFLN
jgi:hypothetical protein